MHKRFKLWAENEKNKAWRYNDVDDEYDELCHGWPTKDFLLYFHKGRLSEMLTIANLQHAASRIWTCVKPEFRLWWMNEVVQ